MLHTGILVRCQPGILLPTEFEASVWIIVNIRQRGPPVGSFFEVGAGGGEPLFKPGSSQPPTLSLTDPPCPRTQHAPYAHTLIATPSVMQSRRYSSVCFILL